ncbi:LacI family DNA-binding transcriptional regulator [Pradoshia sp.]
MAVTIKDVAKKANVAPSTVSRVIADSPSISDKTKRKVRKVMKELGYHLNANARNLVTKTTKTIGIVLKHSARYSLHNPFFQEVLRGIGSYCRGEGYSLCITTGDSEKAIFEDVIQMVEGRRVDGLIILYSRKEDEMLHYLLQKEFPFVVVGHPGKKYSGVTYVDNDNQKAAKDLTEFLLFLHHKHIAFFGGVLEYDVVSDRLKGYKEALKSAGIRFSPDYVKPLSYSRKDGMAAIEELYALPEPPTAYIALDIDYAIILTGLLARKNLRIPEDASIVCFNNYEVADYTTPSLTTMEIHTYELGIEAAKYVIELILNPQAIEKNVLIPTRIIERESHQSINHEKPAEDVLMH